LIVVIFIIVIGPAKYKEEDLIIYHNHVELWLSNSIGYHKKSKTAIKITRDCENSAGHSTKILSKNMGKL